MVSQVKYKVQKIHNINYVYIVYTVYPVYGLDCCQLIFVQMHPSIKSVDFGTKSEDEKFVLWRTNRIYYIMHACRPFFLPFSFPSFILRSLWAMIYATGQWITCKILYTVHCTHTIAACIMTAGKRNTSNVVYNSWARASDFRLQASDLCIA